MRASGAWAVRMAGLDAVGNAEGEVIGAVLSSQFSPSAPPPPLFFAIQRKGTRPVVVHNASPPLSPPFTLPPSSH